MQRLRLIIIITYISSTEIKSLKKLCRYNHFLNYLMRITELDTVQPTCFLKYDNNQMHSFPAPRNCFQIPGSRRCALPDAVPYHNPHRCFFQILRVYYLNLIQYSWPRWSLCVSSGPERGRQNRGRRNRGRLGRPIHVQMRRHPLAATGSKRMLSGQLGP